MVERAADLRRAFDQSFSEPPVGLAGDTESLLAFQAGGHAYAVRLAEISGLFADRTIVRLPSRVSEFLGVAGLRHDVVPLYSLRTLLGHEMGGDPPRWLIIARAAHPVAFAFEQFEGFLQLPPSALLPAKDAATATHLQATIGLGDGMRGVVSISSLLKRIEERIRRAGTSKEQ
jgi:chemotaxis signal transduction protein